MPSVQREQESIIHWILIVFYEYHFCQNPITILTKIAETNIILSLRFDQSCVVTDRVSISIQTPPVWAPLSPDLPIMYLRNRSDIGLIV
jgi:hypothetical protein